MLPLSTGCSPKIDQFYHSMRSIHLSVASNFASDQEQERSLEHIRSIGRQLLSKPKVMPSKKQSEQIKIMNKTLRNPLQIAKEQRYGNLYGKHYKTKESLIENSRDRIRQDLQQKNCASDQEQERSIEHIRSIGRQLLSKPKVMPSKKQSEQIKIMNKTLRNPLQIAKEQRYGNLYDKYKGKHHKTKESLIVNRRNKIKQDLQQNIVPEEKKNYWKNPKYQKVESKIYKKEQFSINSLNYTKRTNKQTQEQNIVKKETKNAKQVIKNNGDYYKKHRIAAWDGHMTGQGVVERGENMLKNKALKIEKMRRDQIKRLMEGVTFSPQRISRRYSTLEKTTLTDRSQANRVKRVNKQSKILREELKTQTFRPKLNYNNSSGSIIKQLWQSQDQKQKRYLKSRYRTQGYGDEEREQGQNKDRFSEYPTDNTNSKVFVRNLQQVNFIFQDL